jgi:NAD(P)-dependent dehydrogenase (short-subunit alcohol dehydrogenase family)
MTDSELPAPGVPIDNLCPLRRVGQADEIATAIAFLASGVCDFLTGSTLVVDGGQIVTGPKPSWH